MELKKDDLKALIKEAVRTELDGTEFRIEQPIGTHSHEPTEELDSCPECHSHTLKTIGKDLFECKDGNCKMVFSECEGCNTKVDARKQPNYCPNCEQELDWFRFNEQTDGKYEE